MDQDKYRPGPLIVKRRRNVAFLAELAVLMRRRPYRLISSPTTLDMHVSVSMGVLDPQRASVALRPRLRLDRGACLSPSR